MEDRYRDLRNLPFDVLAGALGIDLGKFRQRKGGTEWAGNCPVHQPKKNGTAFSYNVDGRWNCFSCQAMGRGAIDVTMKVRGIAFQEAVSILEPFATGAMVQQAKRPEIKQLQVQPTENQPFRGTSQPARPTVGR
jgi:DNA primase